MEQPRFFKRRIFGTEDDLKVVNIHIQPHISALIFASSASALIRSPFQTAALSLQIGGSHYMTLKYKHTVDFFVHNCAKYGWQSVFRGFSAGLLQTPLIGINFALYVINASAFKEAAKFRKLDTLSCFLSGAFSGSVLSFYQAPIEFIETRRKLCCVSAEKAKILGEVSYSEGYSA
eukprot:Sdes_comp8825_c0_seq1m210